MIHLKTIYQYLQMDLNQLGFNKFSKLSFVKKWKVNFGKSFCGELFCNWIRMFAFKKQFLCIPNGANLSYSSTNELIFLTKLPTMIFC